MTFSNGGFRALNWKHQQYEMWSHPTRCSGKVIIPQWDADKVCLWDVDSTFPESSLSVHYHFNFPEFRSVLSFLCSKVSMLLWRQMSSTLCREWNHLRRTLTATGFIFSFPKCPNILLLELRDPSHEKQPWNSIFSRPWVNI